MSHAQSPGGGSTGSPTQFEGVKPQGNEDFMHGGLFDEFMRLQPAQLSWGGVVSVLGKLIQSHGQCLARLASLEDAVGDLRSSCERRVSSPLEPAGPSVSKLYSVLQLDPADADRAVAQAEMEGPNSHAKVKLLHCLPAFSTLIDDIRDVLVPLSDGALGGHHQQQAQPPPPPPAPAPAPASHASGRPMVGLEIVDAVPSSSDRLSSSGVRVFAVRPDGPAAMGGVRDGDCILALNGTPVTTRGELKDVMSICHPGDIVKVDLLRDGEPDPFEVHIRLGVVPGSSLQTQHNVVGTVPAHYSQHRPSPSPSARGGSRQGSLKLSGQVN